MPVDIAKLSTLSSAPLAQIRKIVAFATGEDHSKHVVEDEMDPGALSSKKYEKQGMVCLPVGTRPTFNDAAQYSVCFAFVYFFFACPLPHTLEVGQRLHPSGNRAFHVIPRFVLSILLTSPSA
jgi:hypothetical protein